MAYSDTYLWGPHNLLVFVLFIVLNSTTEENPKDHEKDENCAGEPGQFVAPPSETAVEAIVHFFLNEQTHILNKLNY